MFHVSDQALGVVIYITVMIAWSMEGSLNLHFGKDLVELWTLFSGE